MELREDLCGNLDRGIEKLHAVDRGGREEEEWNFGEGEEEIFGGKREGLRGEETGLDSEWRGMHVEGKSWNGRGGRGPRWKKEGGTANRKRRWRRQR